MAKSGGRILPLKTPTLIDALLFNFDIDSFHLKIEHERFLDEVIKFAEAPVHGPITVSIDGFASRTGTAKHNLILSEDREQAVEGYLRAHTRFFDGGSTSKINRNFHGFADSPPGENARFRSVRIVVHRPGPPPPPVPVPPEPPPLPPPQPPPTPPPAPQANTTKFKIRMHANLNASAKGAADFAIFQIWDDAAGLCSFYTYWGLGAAGGLIPGAWLSATLKGPWNDFSTSEPLSVNQFGGKARFTSSGLGPWTKNYVNFMSLPSHAVTVPNPLPISTGFTIGIGVQTSAGLMRLEHLGTPDGVLPFAGP